MPEDECLAWHQDDSQHQLSVVLDALPTSSTATVALWIGAQPWRSLFYALYSVWNFGIRATVRFLEGACCWSPVLRIFAGATSGRLPAAPGETVTFVLATTSRSAATIFGLEVLPHLPVLGGLGMPHRITMLLFGKVLCTTAGERPRSNATCSSCLRSPFALRGVGL